MTPHGPTALGPTAPAADTAALRIKQPAEEITGFTELLYTGINIMDILCTCCGEPWDIYHLLHEAPEDFIRHGCLVTACPCCQGKPPIGQARAYREHLDMVAEVARLHGGDIDGFACFVEDLIYR
ncbi:MAG: hypothetical protein GXY83_28015 [Rhodopirellula sp.]|nr:hypothetical protein [Rhodopirellula sp.]